MAQIASSDLLDSNPGSPANSKGPSWPPTQFDSVRLPNNKTIGETSNEELRAQLLKLNVEDAATEGRHIIAERWAKKLQGIFDAAGNQAVAEFFSKQFEVNRAPILYERYPQRTTS